MLFEIARGVVLEKDGGVVNVNLEDFILRLIQRVRSDSVRENGGKFPEIISNQVRWQEGVHIVKADGTFGNLDVRGIWKIVEEVHKLEVALKFAVEIQERGLASDRVLFRQQVEQLKLFLGNLHPKRRRKIIREKKKEKKKKKKKRGRGLTRWTEHRQP